MLEERQSNAEKEFRSVLQALKERLERVEADVKTQLEKNSVKCPVVQPAGATPEFERIKQEPITPHSLPHTLGESKLLQKPVKYDGRTPWEPYLAQFNIAAHMNSWDEPEKAAFLAISLTGPALAVLGNLAENKHNDFQALVSALQLRFGSGHQAEIARVSFKNRVRHRDETLPELAEDIERLGRLAYPYASDEVKDSLELDQFIDAQPDDDMRLRVRQNCPKALREAVELALELESFLLASKHRVHQVQQEDSQSARRTEWHTEGKESRGMWYSTKSTRVMLHCPGNIRGDYSSPREKKCWRPSRTCVNRG